MCAATARRGTGGRRNTQARACASGRRPSPPGASGMSPRRSGRAARRACGPGQHRAGLWHRLRVGLAGPLRRAAGRPGQLRGPAGHRPPAAEALRVAVPADPRQRRAGTVRRRGIGRSWLADLGGRSETAIKGSRTAHAMVRTHRRCARGQAGAAAHVQSLPNGPSGPSGQRASGRVKHTIGGAERRVVELRGKHVVAARDRGQCLNRQFTHRRALRREHRPRVLPRCHEGRRPQDYPAPRARRRSTTLRIQGH